MNTDWWIKFFGKKTSYFAWLTTIIASLYFLFSMAGDAVIGESARLISEYSGSDPFTPLSYGLWGFTGRMLQWLPIGTLSFSWNLLSVLCGSAAIGLNCLLVSRLVGNNRDFDIAGPNVAVMRNLAGLTASLLLIFCTPFQLISTMAHPAAFNLVLLFFSIWLTLRFIETSSFNFALASSAVFGLTVTQYATAVTLVPVYGIVMLYWFWRKNLIRPAPILLMIAVFAVSLAPYFIHAAYFMQQPAYHWAEMKSYGDVVWNIWREQYLLIRYGLPNVGWTIVLLFSLVPAVMVIIFKKEMKISTTVMMLVAAAVGMLLFFNVRFAPWPMLGFRPLLIMPYVIGAAWCGCLAAYGLGVIQSSWFLRMRRNRVKGLESLIIGIYLGLLAGIVLATAILNRQGNNFRSSQAIARFAEAAANQIQDSQWVIVDEYLEPLIRIKLAEGGKSALLLSESRFNNPPYQNALCDYLNDGHLCNMARLGLVPLLRERLHPSRGDHPVVASIGDPGVLRFTGQPAIPDRTLFTTSTEIVDDPDRYMQLQRNLWMGAGSDLIRSADLQDVHHDTKNRLLLKLSRAANDAGLLMEDRERPDLAREAYRESARLFKYNISARLNLLRLTDPADDEYSSLTNEIETISIILRGKTDLNQIMDTYGFIRHPDSVITDASRWSRTGSKEMAMQALDSTMTLAGIENAMTAMSDEEAYHFIISAITPPAPGQAVTVTTNHLPALISAIRLSVINDRISLARKFFSQMTELDVSEELLVMEDANIELADGNREAAYQKLTALNETSIKDPRAWIMLALVTTEIKPNEAGRYLEKLEAYQNLPPQYQLTLAKIYISQGDIDSGTKHLARYLQSRPLDQGALQLLLGIRLDQNRMDMAMPLVRQLLQLDTRHALANYALGVTHYQAGRLQEAQSAWEVSLESDPTPEAQNDYAYLLHEIGENDRALEMVELSLQTRQSSTVWHTKAVILVALDRQNDALEAIEKGLAIQPENPDLLTLKNTLLSREP